MTVTPHKLKYQVGDTIVFSSNFSDSIYDLNTEETFKIEHFPFKPATLLWRFYEGTNWDAGYRVNEWIIADKHEPDYEYSSRLADFIDSKSTYEEGNYIFEIQLVLKEKGRYIFQQTDIYGDNEAGGFEEENEEANSITFEGKCPTFKYYPCTMIESGDAHRDLFVDELLHIDKDIYFDNYTDFSSKNSTGIYGRGGLAWEWTGTFGFIVE